MSDRTSLTSQEYFAPSEHGIKGLVTPERSVDPMIKSLVTMFYRFRDHSREELTEFVENVLFPRLDDIEKLKNESLLYYVSYDIKEVEVQVHSEWKKEEFNSDWDMHGIIDFEFDSSMITPRRVHQLIKFEGNLARTVTSVRDTDWEKY